MRPAAGAPAAAAPQTELPDISEKGRGIRGEPISLDRRLFMQMLAFGNCHDAKPVIDALAAGGITAALYADINDPYGIGLMVAAENPEFFAKELRCLLNAPAFRALTPKPEYTMLGRTYSIGYENDLEHVLFNRPISRLIDPEQPWAVWYPLRRAGAFAKLSAEEQKAILAEHGQIGATYSAAGFGQDIRLDCHGLDKNDNDFVIGLIGKKLHPLSAMVQTMRKTRQTSEFLTNLGPFFVGHVIWQSPTKSE
jgi:chlorite dismutase